MLSHTLSAADNILKMRQVQEIAPEEQQQNKSY
jgi:hypothetical protein